jgi:hypothetical protein
MFKKVLPLVFLSAFIAAPIASPALAGSDATKCEKIQDAKKKAECLRMLKEKK